jgi:RNA polymerase sigma-70 factor (ECF subfamily)
MLFGRRWRDSGRNDAVAARKIRLRRIFEDSHEQAWRVLKRLGVPAERLDDAVQQVFLITAERLDDIVPGRERAFVYGVALHHARNVRRRAWREVLGSEDSEPDQYATAGPSPEALLDQKQCAAICTEVLETMDAPLREVFVLFEIEGLKMHEIADVVGIPAGTVASRLRRARSVFRARVTNWGSLPLAAEGGL